MVSVCGSWLTCRSYISRMTAPTPHLRPIASAVPYCDATGHGGVRFSRDRKAYASASRYRPLAFNERFLAVIDDLAAIGILKQVKGDRWKCTTAQKFFRAMQRPSAGMNVETVPTYSLKQSFMALGKGLELPFKPSTSDVQFINE